MNNDASACALPALGSGPAKLFVEVTTRCNLACAMCVKHAPGGGLVEGSMSPRTFAALEPVFAGLEALVLNGIGEPLLHPFLEEFIARARRSMPSSAWIGFQSNGLLLNEKRAASLEAAGLDRICLSMDALSPDKFRAIRQGGELASLQQAFTALQIVRNRRPGSRLRIGAEFVARRDNVRELPALIGWLGEQGGDFAIVTQLLPYDEKHLGKIAYDTCTDAAVALYEKWRGKAAHQGIDLSRGLARVWRSGGRRDRKVLELIEAMKEEARSREIFLNAQQLVERDVAAIDEVTAAFEEATEAARRTGIVLHLPATIPRQQRRCPFVEEGGAFISWDGQVHPCYNLWHGYRCYINGWEKTVRPRVFGSLDREPLPEIWNRSSFREFRRNVLSYDYPFCSNCTVAPCDYIQAEEFEQDCYVRSEPCGACLWSMGILQCLQ